MSAPSQTTDRSTPNFTLIFQAGSNRYKSLTGQDLQTHPFAAALHSNNTPDSILNIFRKQAEAFDDFRKGDHKLMAWLTPIVNILLAFSGTLGEGIGLPFSPAKTIFTGIGVLLGVVRDVSASYQTLVNLLERIQFFLQRLNHYTAVQLTPEMTELLGRIMAHVLSILALSTKSMKEKRIKKVLKRLRGKTVVEDAFAQLDTLTKEENLMTAARTLAVAHHLDDNVTVIKEVVHKVDGNVMATKELAHEIHENTTVARELTHDVHKDVSTIREDTRSIGHNIKVIKHTIGAQQRNQLRDKLRTWLTPPSPSINHNTACDTQHDGTAQWFVRDHRFNEWKMNGSLLWIRGNPGSGKTIICSTIIEDIKKMRKSKSVLVAYHYFDFKDAAKRDVRGLLTSILLQLCDGSDDCRDVFSRLYAEYGDGSEHPSDVVLARYLDNILDLPGQVPVFIIIDALDECPNNFGAPSAREKVLNFVEDLVLSKRSNLFLCITSRPEQDIQSVLNPLTSALRRVSLQEEGGQKEDINNYVRFFVQNDRAMRRWRAEDKELLIDVLSKRANGMFRWVYCRLDNLRRCVPTSIRKALDELSTTLDETYERALRTHKSHNPDMFYDSSSASAHSGYPVDLSRTMQDLAITIPPAPVPVEVMFDAQANVAHATKPFKCPYCPYSSARKHNLKTHIGTHNEENSRRFVCDICMRGFSRSHDLRRHRTSRHGSEEIMA